MPSCGTLLGRYEPCKQYVGGIKAAYFVPFEFANRVTKNGTGVVTLIDNGTTTTPISAPFWELKGLSTIETTITASRDNGTSMYETIFTLSFKPSGLTAAAGDIDMDSIPIGLLRPLSFRAENGCLQHPSRPAHLQLRN